MKSVHVSEFMRLRGEQTRQKVYAFFREHPFATQEQCANALGVSIKTVGKHVQVLKQRMLEDMKV